MPGSCQLHLHVIYFLVIAPFEHPRIPDSAQTAPNAELQLQPHDLFIIAQTNSIGALWFSNNWGISRDFYDWFPTHKGIVI